MYQDFSLHVSQYKNLFRGLVLFPRCIGPYSFNYGLAGNYRPQLAKALIKGRTLDV